MKGYKYTIKIENYDTNESYIEYQTYSNEYNEMYRTMLSNRVAQVDKDIQESEMTYDCTIYGRSDENAEFITYTFTIFKRD